MYPKYEGFALQNYRVHMETGEDHVDHEVFIRFDAFEGVVDDLARMMGHAPSSNGAFEEDA